MPEHITHFVFPAPSNAHECLLCISAELTDKLGNLKSRTILLKKAIEFSNISHFFNALVIIEAIWAIQGSRLPVQLFPRHSKEES